MRLLLVLLTALFIITAPAQAEEVIGGFFTETATDKASYDYSFRYIIGSTRVEGVPVRIQVNDFSFGLTENFLNVGNINIAGGKDITLSFAPGLCLESTGRTYWGGNTVLAFPELYLTVEHRFYAGSSQKNLTFANWTPTKVVGVQLYGIGGVGPQAHWYLGPTVSAGPFSGYAARRIGAPGWALGINGSLKF